ncbi:MAG: sigma-70 family RNA polymerase sigma factor [Bacilli bacterium]|jgi:RNA polymerase primary sigma factor|nr:sigma-70 family RNA polymerase sigma factor [Bacilli bacterium]
MIEELYKAQLEELTSYGDEHGYIPIGLITKLFSNDDDELLDEVIAYLENKNYEVTKDDANDDAIGDDDLNIEALDDDLDDIDDLDDKEPNDDELILEQEAEIKVSDMDNMYSASYQSDDIVKMYLHEIGQIERLTITQELEFARLVQDGLMAKEKLEQCEKSGKKLNEEEVKELEDKVSLGKQAQDMLIDANLRLVVYIAKRYMGRGLPFSDLIQEGNLGLMKAVLKYDPTRGFKFSTYATWWIRQSITRAIADKGRNVRIPVHMHECINRLARTKRRLVQELHREPTIEELAEEMKTTVEKIIELQRVAQDSISFDNAVGDEEDSTLIDLVADDNTLNPLEYTEKTLYREEIDDVLQTLTPREEMVIRLRYGIGVDRSHTLEEVGKIMGVTRERVRQIEAKALSRLRHHQRMNRLKQHIE